MPKTFLDISVSRRFTLVVVGTSLVTVILVGMGLWVNDLLARVHPWAGGTLLLVASLSCTLVLLGYLRSALVRPILDLARQTRAAEARARGGEPEDWSRGDEISALSEAFQRMSERVQEGDRVVQEQMEALGQAMSVMRAILDAATEGIVGLDGQGRILFANAAALTLLGREGDTVQRLNLFDLLDPRDESGEPVSRDDFAVGRSLTRGGMERARTVEVARRDGSRTLVDVTVAAAPEPDRHVAAVATFEDVTARRALEGHVHRARRLEGVARIAAGMAHELNTPAQYVADNVFFLRDAWITLEALLEMGERMAEGVLSGQDVEVEASSFVARARAEELSWLREEVPAAVGQSLQGVDTLARIVRAMSEFSRSRRGAARQVDLNRELRTALSTVNEEWRSGADVRMDLDPYLPRVACQPEEIAQVFISLMSNAVRAVAARRDDPVPRQRRIEVSTRQVADTVEIVVKDNGIGIASRDLDRIFDPFFSTWDSAAGAGQGLAVAHSVVVDHHGGTLDVDSVPGQGSTFVIGLPLRAAPAPRNPSRPAPAGRGRTHEAVS